EQNSLNTLALLPELISMNIASVKIEGGQSSPAYVTEVARGWRAAIDQCKKDPHGFKTQPRWMSALGKISEGTQPTLG
ncbi:U32 family peptidase, partial [Proteus mirabilis]|uniref:U32 family peptidase n=1 Tax=Proteus mirabilis TaxID=584 RepID=UPI00391DD0D4